MGYGGKYGQQYGLDEGVVLAGPTGFIFRRDETVTTVDTLPDHWLGREFRQDEVVTSVDSLTKSPQDYNRREDEIVTATDGIDEALEDAAADRTTGSPRFKLYSPVVDLNMVEARLTNRARYYLSRGIHDGTLVQPVRFELGTGWENPRWGEPPKPSPDATEVAHKVWEGSVYDGRMYSEEANASTLVIRCAGPDEPDYTPTELMIYAIIRHSSNSDENYHEFPFANATFPSWFHTTDQRFVTRVVLPLGYGARVPTYRRPPIRIHHEDLYVVDNVRVEVDFDVFSTGGE